MSIAALARVVAYGVAVLLVCGLAVAGNVSPPSPEATWRKSLQGMEYALDVGDVRGATRAWEEAYRAAMAARTPEGMLEVGRAALRRGDAAGDHQMAVSQARRIFLAALFQARERRDSVGIAHAGVAFASLGDHELADRAFAVAAALAGRDRDVVGQDRVAALRTHSYPARRSP
jgi:hypothetical protein